MSGKEYQIGELKTGYHQYVDRLYQLDYGPEELYGCIHIITYGHDKMISEVDECVSLEVDRPVDL